MGTRRRWGLVVALIVAVWGWPVSARAEGDWPTPCTWEWEPQNRAWQHGDGNNGLWMKYAVQTELKWVPCQIGAYVEGSVSGVSNSHARASGHTTASLEKQVMVQGAGEYHVQAKHSRATLVGEIHLGVTYSSTTVNGPEENLWGWGGTSPLVLDVQGNGFQLTSAKHGVLFDLDGDGAREQVGWTHKNSDDVWLALDRNGNGVIDSGKELFGNFTPVTAGGGTAANGFDALAFSDTGFTNVLDASDPVWSQLLVWRDANHNGMSEPGELTTVVGSGLVSIDLNYETVSKTKKGNEIRQRSVATWGTHQRLIVDVWLDEF